MTFNELINNKNNNLTLIRIVLAVLVIYSHSFPLTNSLNVDFFYKLFKCFSSGGMAVTIFFFISGAFITRSYLNNKNIFVFIVNRLFRLIPALFISAICIAFIAGPILTNLSYEEYFYNKYTYKFIFNNLKFTTDFALPGVFENLPFKKTVNGSWWTLKYEFFCYILLLILGVLGIFKNKKIFFIISIIFIYLTITDSHLITGLYINPNITSQTYYLPMYFVLGSLCFVFGSKININSSNLIAIICLTYLSKDSYLYPYLLTVSSIFLVIRLAITPLIMKLKVKHDISYGIYIYGFFVQQLMVFLFPNMNYLFNILFSIPICIGLGFISAIYIEEPCMKLAKQITKKFKSN